MHGLTGRAEIPLVFIIVFNILENSLLPGGVVPVEHWSLRIRERLAVGADLTFLMLPAGHDDLPLDTSWCTN